MAVAKGARVLPVLLLAGLLTACGDNGASLACSPFDLDDANALVTNGDTGKRKIEGDIKAAVLVESKEKFRGSTVGFVAINVDGRIVTLAHLLPDGMWASMDAVSELATSFPQGSDVFGVSDDTDGVAQARECAASGNQPTTIAPKSGFDVEAWRTEAVARFGPEETHSDGSKDDYVQLARMICIQPASERSAMQGNLGANYEGSVQQFIIEEFCPNI